VDARSDAPGAVTMLYAPGQLSTGDFELNSSFAPDGRTVYYTKRSPKAQFWVIVESHLMNGMWSTPTVTSFSGQYNDFDPFVSPDGSRLYYSSNRPANGVPKTDFDIWYVERNGEGWGEPKHVAAPVNTPASEFYPSISRNGWLYFSSDRPGGLGSLDIYRARPTGDTYVVENLGAPVNSAQYEGDPAISANDSTIFFAGSGRAGGFGDRDIYVSRLQASGEWSTPSNLGRDVNSPTVEFCPILSPDGRYLFITSDRGFADRPMARRLTYPEFEARARGSGNGLGDIYRVDLRALGIAP
jgi:Tol biopolymer transport system component